MPTNSSNGAPKDPITSGAKAALDAFNMTIGAGAEHGYDVFQSAMQTWLKETQRFQEEMFSQGAAALERLRTCKSPVDVLTVEQAWVAARSRAYPRPVRVSPRSLPLSPRISSQVRRPTRTSAAPEDVEAGSAGFSSRGFRGRKGLSSTGAFAPLLARSRPASRRWA